VSLVRNATHEEEIPMATAKKTATKKTNARTSAPAFSDAERSAMKERAQEARKERAGAKEADDEQTLRDKIAEMSTEDRELAEQVHAIITDAAPELAPRTWYGMPAYAKDGNVVCFFQPAAKFKARYSTLGFNDPAALDDGAMWPTAYALTKVTAAEEKKIRTLVRKAAG
jgi:uncharacterized protein YdhG (YjbR/CyaY superfamily)